MLTAQIEAFSDVIAEAKPLLEKHWEELAIHQDKIPLDPNYEVYFAREARGETLLGTLRCDGKLVGYWMNFVAPGLHYKSTLTMTMDILWVHPDHRGGLGGIRLSECVKKEAKRRGVQLWYAGSKNHKQIAWFLEGIGMAKTEEYFSSWIGD
jgi:hypothetical protein